MGHRDNPADYDEVASHSSVDDTSEQQTTSESASMSEVPSESKFKTFVKQKKLKSIPTSTNQDNNHIGNGHSHHENNRVLDEGSDVDHTTRLLADRFRNDESFHVRSSSDIVNGQNKTINNVHNGILTSSSVLTNGLESSSSNTDTNDDHDDNNNDEHNNHVNWPHNESNESEQNDNHLEDTNEDDEVEDDNEDDDGDNNGDVLRGDDDQNEDDRHVTSVQDDVYDQALELDDNNNVRQQGEDVEEGVYDLSEGHVTGVQ